MSSRSPHSLRIAKEWSDLGKLNGSQFKQEQKNPSCCDKGFFLFAAGEHENTFLLCKSQISIGFFTFNFPHKHGH